MRLSIAAVPGYFLTCIFSPFYSVIYPIPPFSHSESSLKLEAHRHSAFEAEGRDEVPLPFDCFSKCQTSN